MFGRDLRKKSSSCNDEPITHRKHRLCEPCFYVLNYFRKEMLSNNRGKK